MSEEAVLKMVSYLFFLRLTSNPEASQAELLQSGLSTYLGEDVGGDPSSHQDSAQLLQQSTLGHGPLAAAGGTGRVGGRDQDPYKL